MSVVFSHSVCGALSSSARWISSRASFFITAGWKGMRNAYEKEYPLCPLFGVPTVQFIWQGSGLYFPILRIMSWFPGIIQKWTVMFIFSLWIIAVDLWFFSRIQLF
jgi:hypothetical protein